VLQEERYYLDQLRKGPKGHRQITKLFIQKFDASAAKTRDELIRKGLIVILKKQPIGKTNRLNYIMQLTNKPVVEKPRTVVIEGCWPDGSVKSTGNAFDWRNQEQKLMSRREIKIAQQKYHNNNPITVYSRA